jgi:hypothetical protein
MMRSKQLIVWVMLSAALLPASAEAQTPGEPPPEPEPTIEPAAPPESSSTRAVDSAAEDSALTNELDNALEESDIDKSDRAPLPWHASMLWDQGFGTAGLYKPAGQTYDPTFVWDFQFSAGINFNADTTFSVIQPMTVELTDSNSTTHRQQLLLDDTGLDLAHTFLRASPREGQALKLGVAGRILLPTSLASRAATMVVGTRARFAGKYVFERVLHGLLTYAELRYTHRFNRSNTVMAEEPFLCSVTASDVDRNCAHLGGTNTRHLFLLLMGGDLAFAKSWTLGASASFGWRLADGLADARIRTASNDEFVLGDTSSTHWRNTYLIELSVGYEFARWFSLAGLITNSASQRSPDGSIRAPFQPLDTAVGVRLMLSFDELYISTRPDAGG